MPTTRPYTFKFSDTGEPQVLDRTLPELISDGTAYIVSLYGKPDAIMSAVCRSYNATTPEDIGAVEKGKSALLWLDFVFGMLSNYPAAAPKFRGEEHPLIDPRTSFVYSNASVLRGYLSNEKPASLKSLLAMLVLYNDLIKYRKDWRALMCSSTIMEPIRSYLFGFFKRNVELAFGDPRPSWNRRDSYVYPLFYAGLFLETDDTVDGLFELLVYSGLITRYRLRNDSTGFVGADRWGSRGDYWMLSCLVKPELTEYFITEYLLNTRRPTYFERFNIGTLLSKINGVVGLNPNFQKARTVNIVPKLGKFNSYRIEMLSYLVPLLDDINPLTVDLMSLQLNDTNYQRAKSYAEKILGSKQTFVQTGVGNVPVASAIDKFKEAYEIQERMNKKRQYDDMVAPAIALASTLRFLNKCWLNQLCFGWVEPIWDV